MHLTTHSRVGSRRGCIAGTGNEQSRPNSALCTWNCRVPGTVDSNRADARFNLVDNTPGRDLGGSSYDPDL
jgi:hypothetical protein